MTYSVEVKSTMFGSAAHKVALAPVHLELVSERISVKELIRRTVTEQIRTLKEVYHAEAETVHAALRNHYLAESDMTGQARSGFFRLLTRPVNRFAVDIDSEIKKAWTAFERGRFKILFGGNMLIDLSDELTLTQTSQITFLRIVPLTSNSTNF